MALEKQIVVDRIEVVGLGSVQVRTATKIIEDGAVISQSFHRHVVNPGDDYSGEDARVQAVCAAAHTQDAIDAYKAATAPKEI
jgi:hypothetical protein